MSAILVTATTAKTGTVCTAVVNGITTDIQVARDLTVAAGDVLLVERVGSQWFAVVRVYSAAPATPGLGDPANGVAPDPKPPVRTGSLVVSPVETRSYRSGSGWIRDDTTVRQGTWTGSNNYTGAVFYGAKPRSLAGATVTRATIRVRRASSGGLQAAQSTTLRLMTQATKPGGAPTLGSSTAGPSLARGGTNNAFVIPDSWAQAMVNGTAGGLAFFDSDGSPYVVFNGRGEWSPAFTMTITWRR